METSRVDRLLPPGPVGATTPASPRGGRPVSAARSSSLIVHTFAPTTIPVDQASGVYRGRTLRGMRSQPFVLITRDQSLVDEVRRCLSTPTGRTAADLVVCPALLPSHHAPTLRSKVLLGADLTSELSGEPDRSTWVALAHHEAPPGQVLYLPDEADWLARYLSAVDTSMPDTPALAVVGSSGGVGASTVAQGIAVALRASTRAQVNLVDLDDALPGHTTAGRGDPDWPVAGWPDPGWSGSDWSDTGWPDPDAGVPEPVVAGPEAAEQTLRSAAKGASVVVVDLPRWRLGLLPWMDAVVVVLGNREQSVRAGLRVVNQVRREGLEPSVALSGGPGGLWVRDVESILRQPVLIEWPLESALARAGGMTDLGTILRRPKWRSRCLGLAEAALTGAGSGEPR